MSKFDGRAFGEQLVDAFSKKIDSTVKPMLGRLEALEKARAERGEKGEPGKDGTSVTLDDVMPEIKRCVSEFLASIEKPKDGEPGKDGKDAPAVTREQLVDAVKSSTDVIAAAVAEYLKANPPAAGEKGEKGEKGNDGKDAEPVSAAEISAALGDNASLIEDAVAKHLLANPPPAGKDGEPGAPGRDAPKVTKDEISAAVFENVDMIDAAVAKHLEQNPPAPGKDGRDGKDGEHGKSVSVDDVKPLIVTAIAEEVKKIPAPKDGVGLAGAVIDRENRLVVTLTDGSTRDLGVVVGKDGAPGKDGRDGKDGVDGMSLKDWSAVLLEDGKTVRLKLEQGDIAKTVDLVFPVVLYKGIWREDEPEHQAGNAVTFGGQLWVAKRNTAEKPGSKPEHEAEKSDWQLAVRKGRNGKDGKDGERGQPGKDAVAR